MYLKRKYINKFIKILLFLVVALLSFLIIDNWVSAETLSGNGIGSVDRLNYVDENGNIKYVFPFNRTFDITSVSTSINHSSTCHVANTDITQVYSSNTLTRPVYSNGCVSSTNSYNLNSHVINFNEQEININSSDTVINSSTEYNVISITRTDSGNLNRAFVNITTITQGFCLRPSSDLSKGFMYPQTGNTTGGYFSQTNITANAYQGILAGGAYSYDESTNYCISSLMYYFSQTSNISYAYSDNINLPVTTITKSGSSTYVSYNRDVYFTYMGIINNYSYDDFKPNESIFIDSNNNNYKSLNLPSSNTLFFEGSDIDDDNIFNTLFSIKPLDDGLISSFVSIPLKLLNKLQQVFANGLCKPISFGPLNIGTKEFSFTYPCYDLIFISTTFMVIVDSIFCFIIIYNLSYTIIDIFYKVSNLDDLDEINNFNNSKGGL